MVGWPNQMLSRPLRLDSEDWVFSVVEVDVSSVGTERPHGRVKHCSDLGEHAVEVGETAGPIDDDLGGLVQEGPFGWTRATRPGKVVGKGSRHPVHRPGEGLDI